ncbi:hypothetical protein M1O12_03175 [Dehalococcoidia bacterium]|nr:hypothetical protein [Dehalococcoidia bacterium]
MNTSKTAEKDISELVGVFTDPIIAYPSPWMEDIPQWIKDQIRIERLVMNLKVLRGEQPTGTDAEALAYLIPASLERPIGRDWADIYMYLVTTVFTRAGKELPGNIRVETLSEYLMRKLNHLKSWLYQQRVKARLERERGERRKMKEEKEEEIARKRAEQLALFEF